MTDREELFTPNELAVRLDEWANCLGKAQMDLRSDLRCAAIRLRRLASSDGGVEGEPEPVAWPSDGSCVRCGAVPRTASGLCNTCLDEDAERYENAPPADAGMREAYSALCLPRESQASDNLEGALYDIERLSAQGKPTDDICIRTLKRVLKQIVRAEQALTAPGATTKSDGGDLPANLAEIIETELTAWRGVNGGVFTIHAAALGISCAIRSAVFRANNTESDGGHGGQPYASTDAVEGASAPNATSGKQEGRTGIEVGASQTPGSSMSSGQSAPIVAGQAPGQSDRSSTRSEVTQASLADFIFGKREFFVTKDEEGLARALLDQFEIRRK